MSKVWIGTSGWTYDGWRGPFYPEEVRKKDWLAWYATQFPTTEINGSFYRTPSLEAARADARRLPVRLESLEVHHPLEAALGEMRQFD
jgi:uncharacterized protein YecE (DUF72 family)